MARIKTGSKRSQRHHDERPNEPLSVCDRNLGCGACKPSIRFTLTSARGMTRRERHERNIARRAAQRQARVELAA